VNGCSSTPAAAEGHRTPHQTLRPLPGHLSRITSVSQITDAPPSGLSGAQRRLWSIAGPSPTTPFRGHCSVALHGPIEPQRMAARLRAIASREELLRTTFRGVAGEAFPIPVVAIDNAPSFACVDLSAIDLERRHTLGLLVAQQAAAAAFDWEKGPLFSAVLAMLTPSHHLLTIVAPALCSDDTGLENLAQALIDEEDGDGMRHAPAVPYRVLAAWRDERGGAGDGSDREYWRVHAANACRAVRHPFECQVASVSAFSQAVVIEPVPAEQRDALATLAQQLAVSPASILMTAWAVLLARLTGEPDVALGVACDGRTHAATPSAIGPLSRMVPWTGRVDGRASFATLATDVDAQRYELVAREPYFSWDTAALANGSMTAPPILCGFAYDERMPRPRRRYTMLHSDWCGEPCAITLRCRCAGEHLTLALQFDESRFARVDARRVAKQYLALLADAVARPATPVRRLNALDEAERRRVVQDWNDTTVQCRESGCVHEIIEARVNVDPAAVAVVDDGRRCSYGELNERANKLARHLRGLGVGPEVCVGVCLERSLELVVALLGVMKAGGAYVPLDPQYPQGRLALMLDEARPPVVVTMTRHRRCLGAAEARIVCLDADTAHIDAEDATNVRSGVVHGNLAYVIYTSGSTGRPKGVMNVHSGLRNRLGWAQDRWALSSHDRVLQKTPFTFDVSVWEFFWPLMTGACLVVARPGGHQDAAYLAEVIAREQVTMVHFVPSMLDAFLRGPWIERCASLRQVLCSGEALPAALQAQFHERCAAELHNLYGPTEASIDVTHWACRRGSAGTVVPIGRPIANTQIHVLDNDMQPVAAGVSGELHIGGVGLARGYLRQPDLTADRFVPDPLSTEPGARLYRTGDVARHLSDGSVEYLGRRDHQVKIRGNRIETGEIELALDAHPSVQRSLVIAREDVPGHKQLVAYIVANDSGFDAAGIRACLSATLPEYMVPSAFVPLPELPLSPNGKVDRGALPAPQAVPPQRPYIGPRNEAETTLAQIWAEILRVDRVSVDANFFELGGDSILSIQIVARANRAGLHVTPRQMFEHQTVATLAAAARRQPSPEAEDEVIGAWAPLTPIQVWFFEQAFANPNHFNQAVLLQPHVQLDGSAVSAATAAIVRHHATLRSRFTRHEGEWRQRVVEDAAESNVELVNVADGPDWRVRLEREIERVQGSLEITNGPLARVCLVRTPGGERLLIVAHHLIVDGVSWRILLDDLQRAYEQVCRGERIDLGATPTSFARWARTLHAHAGTADAESGAAYWSELLERAAQLKAAASMGIGRGPYSATERVDVRLTEAETQTLLTRLPAVYGTQITEVLLAAFALALRDWDGRTSTLVDVEGHGREELNDLDLSRTVGWFTAIRPVLIAANDEGIEAVLAAVKEHMRAAPHRGVGYGVLRWLTSGQPSLPSPAAPVLFNYLGQADQVFGERALFTRAPETTGRAQAPQNQRPYELSIDALVIESRLSVTFSYAANPEPRQTVADLASVYSKALRSILARAEGQQTRRYTPSDFPLAPLDQATLDELARTFGEIEDVFPLLPLQEGLLFHSVFAPGTEDYFDQLSSRVRGTIDVDAFDRAWHDAVARHPALRTAFAWNRIDQPLQVVLPHARLEIVHEDWRGVPEAEQRARMQQYRVDDRKRGFDLAKPPLMRLALLRTAEAEYHLVWSRHHLLLDGWSRALLLREVLEAYDDVRRGIVRTPIAAMSSREYIARCARQDTSAAETYWRETLRGFKGSPGLGLERRGAPTSAAGYGDQRRTLPAEITAGMRALTRTSQITLNTVMQGIWALLLKRYTGERDVVFGTVVAGRPADLDGADRLIGMFINTLPVRAVVEPDETALPWLRRLQQHQAVQREFELSPLARVQGWSEVARGRRLFDSILVFENYPADPLRADGEGGLEFDDVEMYLRVDVPLALTVMPGAATTLQISYDHNRIASATIARVFSHVEAALAAVLANPRASLAHIERALDECDGRQQAQALTRLERARGDRLTGARRKPMRVG
jgi:amino acid adenylation domain-containing protein/non-ribosomal peptide synthase protein (TIGR01720 family)